LELLRILGSLWKEKREIHVLNIGVDTEQLRTFHILDSLRNNSSGKKEEETLQKLLLKHFEGKSYEKGRITTNIAEAIFFFIHHFHFHQLKQVPCQENLKDCACFTIFFGKKFLSNPDATMGLLKVNSYLQSDDLC
jgi:hypothetical protein